MSIVKYSSVSSKKVSGLKSSGLKISVGKLTNRHVSYSATTVTVVAEVNQIISGTYTQNYSILTLSYTATSVVTATDYYFSGTSTNIAVRYVGPGGYDSIGAATTNASPGTYIYVTNTTTVLSDFVNTASVNLVFAFSTDTTSVVTSTNIGANINMYGNRAITLYCNTSSATSSTFRNFIDLTPVLTSISSYGSTLTSVISQIRTTSTNGCPLQVFSAGANNYDTESRFTVYASYANYDSTPYTTTLVGGPGTSLTAPGVYNTASTIIAVNIWTGTAYRSLIGDTAGVFMVGQGGAEILINAVSSATCNMTQSFAFNGTGWYIVAGSRYSISRFVSKSVLTDQRTDSAFHGGFMQNLATRDPLVSATKFSAAGGGSSLPVSGATLTLPNFVLSTDWNSSSTGVTSVTTGGSFIVFSNATLTKAASMYNVGSAANGYAPTLGNPPWPTLINNLDIYNTQTVIVTGFLPTYATGGTEYTIPGYKVHVFNASGSFATTSGWPAGKTIEYLVVGGGGGGSAGGGGAGGLLANTTPVTLTSGTYAITVGSGGTGDLNATSQGANGTNSSIIGTGISVTSIGGGGGGASTPTAGSPGGSGGGGGHDDNSATQVGGSGTVGQGYAGGDATGKTSSSAAGGGGGAGGLGGTTNTNGSTSDPTNGGLGANSSISGTNTGYAGGGASCPFESFYFRASEGGGGYYPIGGGSYAATNARVNSGGGGFARGVGSPNGADGIVIIRYAYP